MLARVAQKDKRLPGFRAQQWYFFFVATFYLYLRCVHARVCVCLGWAGDKRTYHSPAPLTLGLYRSNSPTSPTLYFAVCQGDPDDGLPCCLCVLIALTYLCPPPTHTHARTCIQPSHESHSYSCFTAWPLSLPLSVPLPPPAASLRTTCWWSSLRAVPWQRLPGCCGGTPSLAIASTWQVRGACRQAVQVQEIGQAVQGSTMAHGWTGFEGGEASGCRGVSARIL